MLHFLELLISKFYSIKYTCIPDDYNIIWFLALIIHIKKLHIFLFTVKMNATIHAIENSWSEILERWVPIYLKYYAKVSFSDFDLIGSRIYSVLQLSANIYILLLSYMIYIYHSFDDQACF